LQAKNALSEMSGEMTELSEMTYMGKMKKLRDILPSIDRRWKDESPIFATSINMFHKI
jgi:hypothetical protein